MPKAAVLGSGTSNGVPMLGVHYPDSFLSNPKNHRFRSSLLLQSGDRNVLVDCAPECRLQLLRANVFDLDAVIVTHTHADHVMGMDDLRSFCVVHKKSMPIYTTPEHEADIRRIFPYAFVEAPPEIHLPRFDFMGLPECIDVGDMRIQTFLVNHGRTDVVALRVNDFAYLTDVKFVPAESERFMEGLDTLILDAVRFRPHPNHLNFEEAMAVIERFRPKRTYLTHLSDDYDHDVFEKTLPDHIRLSYDGLTLDI